MKKSLSLILAIAMVFSMFASVAFAAEATTTETPKTTEEKYDALKALGIFEGDETGANLTGDMTRAQLAKIVTKLLKVEEDKAANTYTDVPADHWAAGFIGAATTAKAFDGVAPGKFDPEGKVSYQQLATVLVRLTGLAQSTDAVTGKVDEWAKGYVATAVKELGLTQADYTVNATRGVFVELTFAALPKVVIPGKVSVVEAKPTGVYKVQVTFNKAVDTAAAKLALTKGTLAVGTSTTAPVWSEDKTTVTLTTDTRITEGTYTVTLSGLDAASVDKTTASFTATDEQVTKIDFVNANDTVAYSKYATIKVKATNQYGEAVSLGASSFTALVSGQNPDSFKKDADGNLVITDDIKSVGGVTQGNGLIPVTVYYNNSNVTASKNFKVGTVPLLTTIETGTVTYSNNGTQLSAADETASIPLKMFDQYGNPIVKGQLQGSTSVPAEISASTINPVITPYEQKLEVVRTNNDYTDFFDDNDNARIKVKLTQKLDKSAEYTVNIYGGSSSATAVVKVSAANLATKFEFDASAVVIAAGDETTIVPLIATDANGNKLSAQDIVDQKTRFNITASNGSATVVETGSDKGKVKITYSAANTIGSKVYVSGTINQSITNTFVQTSIPVGEARVPERITVTTEPATKAILGADSEIVYMLKDQYGKDLKKIAATVPGTNGQTSQFRVKVTFTTEGAAGFNFKATATGTPVVALPTPFSVTPNGSSTETVYYFNFEQLDYFNKGFNLTTEPTVGKVVVKAVVEKAPNGTSNFSDYSSVVTRTLESIKPDTDLTYSLGTIGELYAAQDKLAVGNFTGAATDIATAEQLLPGYSRFDKKLSVVAKDSAGTTVKLPLNYVQGVTVSDPTVVSVAPYTAGGVQDGYVIGNKAGTATVMAVVYTNKGQTINLTQTVTVKTDSISVATLSADNSKATYDAAKTYAYMYFDELKAVDNYGIEYKTNTDKAVGTVDANPIAAYSSVLGIQYTVEVVQGTGSVQLNTKTGEITNVDPTVKEFVITAITPNGKSVTMLVSKP